MPGKRLPPPRFKKAVGYSSPGPETFPACHGRDNKHVGKCLAHSSTVCDSGFHCESCKLMDGKRLLVKVDRSVVHCKNAFDYYSGSRFRARRAAKRRA
jgi:hypothetical protein